MRRFIFPTLPETGGIFSAPKDQIRHLYSVLRVKVGDHLEASCGDGMLAQLEVIAASLEEVSFRVLSKEQGNEVPLHTQAFLAELKSDAMDEAISLLAELGVSAINPFFAERSIAKIDVKDLEKKRLRRQKLADEVVKKVGGLYTCKVNSSRPWKTLLDWGSYTHKILFYENADPSHRIESLDFTQPSAFIIGPEGGFTTQEVDFFINKGFTTFSLGTRIMRAPTACAAAVVQIRTYAESYLDTKSNNAKR
ncbi:MAG: RsmE family RNA methyltransferase [Brevinema sp.]